MLPARLASALVVAALLAPAAARAQPGQGGPAAAPQSGEGLVTITLRDSQLLRGYIVAETGEHIIVRLVSGGEVPVAQADIRSIKRNDESVYVSESQEVYKHDPNRTRYLYGPSAFMLRRGEGYFSQTELVISTLGYGVTDWLTVQVGSMVPALFAGGENFIFGARVGTPLSDQLHVAAGFHSLVLPNVGGVGLATGSVTLGTPKAHVTLSGGRPFAFSEDDSEVGPAVASLSANLRMSKHIGLLTENWVFPGDGDAYMLGSLAARFMGEHSAVDVGFLFLEDLDMPIPWFDFTWNWN